MSKRKNPEAKARQQRNRRQRDLEAGLVPRTFVVKRRCHWCGKRVVWRDVTVGTGGRVVRLLIGADGTTDGRVYRQPDGTWRLAHGYGPPPGVQRFYIHSPRDCLLTEKRWEPPLERWIREAIEGVLDGPAPEETRRVHSPHA